MCGWTDVGMHAVGLPHGVEQQGLHGTAHLCTPCPMDPGYQAHCPVTQIHPDLAEGTIRACPPCLCLWGFSHNLPSQSNWQRKPLTARSLTPEEHSTALAILRHRRVRPKAPPKPASAPTRFWEPRGYSEVTPCSPF